MFRYWLLFGMRMGWISKPYCMTHDGNYEFMTEEEREEWDAGGDPCHTAISIRRRGPDPIHHFATRAEGVARFSVDRPINFGG